MQRALGFSNESYQLLPLTRSLWRMHTGIDYDYSSRLEFDFLQITIGNLGNSLCAGE